MGPSMHIRLLGEFSFVLDGREIDQINTIRPQGLIAYLLLHRHAPQSRQYIAFRLWPDSSEKQARTNLRQLYHRLGRAVPEMEQLLLVNHQTIRLNPDCDCWLDVAEFDRLAKMAEAAENSGNSPKAVELLREAIDLYSGDLLPACYDEWIEAERQRLREAHSSALQRICKLLERSHRYEEAITYADRLLQQDILSESSYRRLMRLHALNQDRAGALHVFEACVRVMQEEFGVQPDPSTRDLMDRILEHGISKPDTFDHPIEERKTTWPFVGREEEWTRFLECWDRVQAGHAHSFVVSGEAGMGKTRFIEEVQRSLALQNVAICLARCYSAEARLAYAPVAEWLRTPDVQEGLERLDNLWLSELARVLPEICEHHPEVRSPGPLTEGWQRQRFFDALSRAVLTVRRPVLLILDDAQWSDIDTIDWLEYLLRFRKNAPILVVAAVRTAELRPHHALRTLCRDLAKNDQLTSVVLAPLGLKETSELAKNLSHDRVQVSSPERLYENTEGNPLFIVEFMRAGTLARVHGETAGDIFSEAYEDLPHIPPKVRAVLESRLNQPTEGAKRVIDIAAAYGQAFSFDMITRMSSSDERPTVDIVEELIQKNILKAYGNNSYDFTHDNLRDLAYARLSPPRRRFLHRKIANVLEDVHQNDLAAGSTFIASHYDRAGSEERAIEYYRHAANAAQRLFANEEAIRLLRRALDILKSLPETTEQARKELSMQTALGVCYVASKGYQAREVNDVYTRILELSGRLGLPASPPALRALAIANIVGGSLKAAENLGRSLLQVAEEGDDAVLPAEANYVLGVSAFWMAEFQNARHHLTRALESYQASHQEVHLSLYAQDPQIICLVRLGQALWYLGYPEQALRRCAESLDLARARRHPFSHAYALVFASGVYIDSGNLMEARRTVSDALHIAQEHKLELWRLMALIYQGWLHVEDGLLSQGIREMTEYHSQLLAIGCKLKTPFILSLKAQGLGRADRPEDALQALDAAIQMSKERNECWLDAEVLRLKAEILINGHGNEDEIRHLLRSSLQMAEAQGARLIALRTAGTHARLAMDPEEKREAAERLRRIYATFNEGNDLPDLKKARRAMHPQ